MNIQNYSSDAPLDDPNLDQFNRYPFAKRIADVISKRNDPSSLVIGIHGVWGGGKTSVFNFIENELQTVEDVVCIKFNPWRFGNEDQMLMNFFNDLADAIDKSITSGKEKIGDIILSYGKPIASLIGKGEAADGIATFFSKADVEVLRTRIESLLEKERKRVVILVDDIDRLEKNEIYSVFRLVKLTADFKYTAYVLAFDQNIVTSALQERYGKESDTKIGNSFLEKIIQVPLQLPALDGGDLRNFYMNEIDQVIKFSDIKLSEEESRQFVSNFYKGLEAHLKTPRQAKLYSNILMFSLPILKDEVNIVDLMLIEGIKVFLPKVYSLIQNQKSLFLESEVDTLSFEVRQNEIKKRKDRIEEVLSEFLTEEKEGIINLLSFLFPKLDKVFRNTHYGKEWELEWEDKQRISSPQYFQRYFNYARNNKDVSDLVMNEIVKYSEFNSASDTADKIRSMITDKNLESFIGKLRTRTRRLSNLEREMLALSISKLSDWLPNPIQLVSFTTPFAQSIIFISDCIERLESREKQIEVANKIICDTDSLAFATECYYWFKTDTELYPNPQGFSVKDYKELSKILADRISTELKDMNNIKIRKISNLPKMILIWDNFGKNLEASIWISQKIKSNPEFLFIFIDSYTGKSFGNFGMRKSEFDKNNYESIKKIVDPILIAQEINAIKENSFKNQIGKIDLLRNEELATQFLRVHQDMIKKH